MFTFMPFDETINFAVNLIFERKPYLVIAKNERLQSQQPIFYLMDVIMIR